MKIDPLLIIKSKNHTLVTKFIFGQIGFGEEVILEIFTRRSVLRPFKPIQFQRS